MSAQTSSFEQLRLAYRPKLPRLLADLNALTATRQTGSEMPESCSRFFPQTASQAPLSFEAQARSPQLPPLRIGVVLSGGQAAGGHNVITGIYDALASRCPGSVLIGFLNGPGGIVKQQWKDLGRDVIDAYRNTGGFDMIGAGRTKIETAEQFDAARKAVVDLRLDGLVIVGGDDSNTNAAFLAEDFKAHGINTRVIGVPKTIDGDLKNQWIETSFGFDTACKTFSETISSMARDAKSAQKYYYFIKLMGRSASHIALECALQTQPNLALISEEVELNGKTLEDITQDICNVICERAGAGKDYGVVLIPEGILEFIPECKMLIKELNALLVEGSASSLKLVDFFSSEEKIEYVLQLLTPLAKKCYQTLPKEIQLQLILDRDPHGNVQVSKIETERLFIDLVKTELKARSKAGVYKGKFAPQPHFCGYEGRSCFPSNFDSNYCYALGHVAAFLISAGATGYMACVSNLAAPVEEWQVGGFPLVGMMSEELRKGKTVPVVRKALVDLQGPVFRSFIEQRGDWVVDDAYVYPGPIQFFGPAHLADAITKTLELESAKLSPSI